MELLSAQSSPALTSIGHIILAAADVDQGIMERLGATTVDSSKSTTSYTSTEDRAIEVSSELAPISTGHLGITMEA